jgi:hypothetical protein
MFYNANLRTVSQRGVDFVMQSFFAALSTQNRIPQVELGVPQPPLRQVPQSPVEDLVCEDLVLEAFRPAAS